MDPGNRFLERPITAFEDDALERRPFIERVGRALVSVDRSRATGVVIGICGEWGSGKSSVLNLVGEHLRAEYGAIVVQFDPWVVSGRDDLIVRLLMQLAQTIGADDRGGAISRTIIEYVEALGPVAGAVGSLFGVPGASAGISTATKMMRKFLSEPDLHGRRELLKSALDECPAPIVVLIDELDRLDDGEIRDITQFVRAVADFEQISYLLAYDPKRVAEALGAESGGPPEQRIPRGTAYLEKIVQYQIPLPALLKAELFRLAEAHLESLAEELGLSQGWQQNEGFERLVWAMIPGLLATPRDLKRWAGMVHVQSLLLRDEVEPFDLMGWCALLTKAPETVARIRRQPGLVRISTDDLGHYEWPEDSQKLPSHNACPEHERSQAGRLVDLLFDSRGPVHPHSICNYRPFMTVVRDGVPPGYYSLKQIKDFLSTGSEARQELMRQAADNGSFYPLFNRIAEVYPGWPASYDIWLWHDFARFLAGNRVKKYAGREIASAFLWAYQPPDQYFAHLRDATRSLMDAEDWQLYPEMLEHQLRAHGLFNYQQNDTPALFSAGETEAMATALAARVISQFAAIPSFLTRLPTPTALHVTSASGAWSSSCHELMVRRIGDDDFLDCFVSLMCGERFTTSSPLLDRLVDFEALRIRAAARRASFPDMPDALATAYDALLRAR